MASRSSFPLTPLIRATWRFLPPERRPHFIGSYVLALAAQTVGLLRPMALGHLFSVLEHGVTGLWGPFMDAVILYVGIAIAFMALHFPSRLLERRTAFAVRQCFYERAYGHLVQYPLEWHRHHHSGDTIDRLRKAGDGLFSFVDGQFRWIQTLTGLVGPILLIGYLSWPIALIITLANVIILFSVARFDRVIVDAMQRQNTAEHRFSSILFDYIAHMTTILSLRLSQKTKREVGHVHGQAKHPFMQHVNANEGKYASISLLLALLEAGSLLLFVGLDLATLGRVRIGMSVAVFRYMNVVGRTFYEAAFTYQDLLRKRTNYEAAEPLLDGKITGDHHTDEITSNDWRTINIENLSYTHPESQRAGLHNVALDLHAGERIALIGPSGAGKTTLLAALRGLLEPRSMLLKMDNQICANPSRFRAGVVFVPQEPELFENTLRFNLTGGLPCTEPDILAAIHDAELEEVIARLPQGLDTDIRERGVNLSGGERQRLALGRALLLGKDARLILLDEATSSVDRITEQKIYERIFKRFEGRTILASIHGLHLLPYFDRALKMENGRLDLTTHDL